MTNAGQLVIDYMDKFGIVPGGPGFFMPVITAKDVIIRSASLGYDTLRRSIKALLSGLEMDPDVYGTHSCRRGAATEMLKAGATTAQTREMVRWKSDAMVATYVRSNPALRKQLTSMIAP